ncbi:MAG: RNA polymerase sigma factor [Candidatus Zixiibacteriota bacterium]|nr:MAG: RNA polymerase sigma factor [candidate division Zixibacteria bacterium]
MEMDTRDSDFDRIFSEYQRSVYNYVLRMVRERSTAEELTQDTFVKIYNALADFRGDSELSTWIYTIATNTCLDHFRSSSHRKSEKTDLLRPEDLLKNVSPEDFKEPPSAEDEVIHAQMSSCVLGYIDDLPEDYRAVILLHDLHGFTNPEIAKITGSTLENVKVRLHRARKKMQEVFSSKCSFYRDERNVLRCVEKEDNGSGDDA